MIKTDRRLTVREIAELLDISVGSAHTILKDKLNMSRVCARWIPRLLTPEQKQNRVDVCLEWKRFVEEDRDWWKSVITADESWVYQYDPAMIIQSTEWVEKNEGRPKKARATKSANKAMVITFFDYKGMVYTHSVPRGQTVNGDYYKQVLTTLMNDHISRKRPELRGNWKLHHDNARPHIAHVVTEYLAKQNIKVVPHPPYKNKE